MGNDRKAFRIGVAVSAIATTFAGPVCVAQTDDGGVYGGVFIGAGRASADDFRQMGMAHRPVGPLYVNAEGRPESSSARLAGVQVGYEWAGEGRFRPAVELEGFYLGNTQRGQLVNPTPEVGNHRFRDTFPIDAGVLLVNSVWSARLADGRFSPYVAVGAGIAVVAVSGADSTQINPYEAGINHFNSNPDATAATLAVQARIGLRGELTDRLDWFGEYRHLRLQSTSYTFGSTVYDNHVPTAPWNVALGDLKSDLATVGLRYSR